MGDHRVSEFLMCNEQQLVEAVRAACIKAALVAYEEGGVGLCAEGRWEYAISAMQQLNLAEVLDASKVIPVGEKEKHGEKSRD